ncbi:hypothetical protein VKS41_001996 [Umbelopsis sp. WA50703]
MQALAFLLTLLLPVILVYFIRNDSKTDSSQPASAKKKKKSKKKATKRLDSTPQSTSTVKSNEADRESETPIEKPQHKDFTQPDTDDKAPPVTLEETTDKPETFVEVKRKKEVDDSQVSRMTIDEDLDGTARYSRVMRIKTDEPVSRPGLEPLEPGWNRAASKPRNVSQGGANANSYEALTKKQRENMAKAAKKRDEKAAQQAEQEARLRQHKRELEKHRINEFYSKGAGKKMTTPSSVWGNSSGTPGTPGSGKRPQGVASLNEHGQLIWD